MDISLVSLVMKKGLKMKKFLLSIIFIFIMYNFIYATGFTQKDRELLIELKVKVQEIDKRFEQLDKRFEQIDKRFEQMMNFLWILTGIFTTFTVAILGFAYWDRRTIISKAKEVTIEVMEREGKLKRLLDALKEYSQKDKRLAEILRQFNLF